MMEPQRVPDAILTSPATAAARSGYCLGSRRRDLLAVALWTLLVLAGSPFLRAYHRVTVMDLSVVRIEPAGQRTPMATPPALWNRAARGGAARKTPAAAVQALEQQIRQLMRSDLAIASAPPGTRFEWTIRYSENSVRLDRSAVYVYAVPTDVPR